MGMLALFGIMVLYLLAVVGFVYGLYMNDENPVLIFSVITLIVFASVLLSGLKVLKPQEALVLTLFGRYVGTLKGDGFYFVNPFCISVNPAAKTRLGQSGDVNDSAALLTNATNSQYKRGDVQQENIIKDYDSE